MDLLGFLEVESKDLNANGTTAFDEDFDHDSGCD